VVKFEDFRKEKEAARTGTGMEGGKEVGGRALAGKEQLKGRSVYDPL